MLNIYVARRLNAEIESHLSGNGITFQEHYIKDDDYFRHFSNRDAIMDLHVIALYVPGSDPIMLVYSEDNMVKGLEYFWREVPNIATQYNQNVLAGWRILDDIAFLHNISIAKNIKVPLWACNAVDRAYSTLNMYDYWNLYKNGSFKNQIDMTEAAYLWSDRKYNIPYNGDLGLLDMANEKTEEEINKLSNHIKQIFDIFENAAKLHSIA